MIQVVVASINAALRSMPSGKKLQASVAQAASVNSAAMPAALITSRSQRRVSRQEPVVSVYSTGIITNNAIPMVGTGTP